jgi:hypothetical protein
MIFVRPRSLEKHPKMGYQSNKYSQMKTSLVKIQIDDTFWFELKLHQQQKLNQTIFKMMKMGND